MDEELEGWYTDPYGRHEARWMSQGAATRLVRDGDVEGSDPVDNSPFTSPPVRIEGHPVTDGSDLLRADDAEREEPFDSEKAVRAAWDVFDQTRGPRQ
jgi:hypothetical protein